MDANISWSEYTSQAEDEKVAKADAVFVTFLDNEEVISDILQKVAEAAYKAGAESREVEVIKAYDRGYEDGVSGD